MQLVCQTTTLLRPLRANIGVMHQSGRALLRAANRLRHQTPHLPIRRRTRTAITAYIKPANANQPFRRTKSTNDIRTSI
jgi:hypothetical protein